MSRHCKCPFEKQAVRVMRDGISSCPDCGRPYRGALRQIEEWTGHRKTVAEQKWGGWIIIALAIAFVWACFARGAEAPLGWNANPETDIAGYEILVGKAADSGWVKWDRVIPVGNVTSHSVTGLDGATLYYFSVRAVNSYGLKSQDAAAITYTTPADIPPLEREGWIVTATSEEADGYVVSRAVDGDAATFWHTTWRSAPPPPPHCIKVELPRRAMLSALRYLPRQDGISSNGNVTGYEIELSDDGVAWQSADSGVWEPVALEKRVELGLRPARFVRLWGNDPWMAAAELRLEGSYEPEPPRTITLTLQHGPLKEWVNLSSHVLPLQPHDFFRLAYDVSGQSETATEYELVPVKP